ncbi:MAG: TonB-dependent receptor [Cyclobacteriaceae bacterium]
MLTLLKIPPLGMLLALSSVVCALTSEAQTIGQSGVLLAETSPPPRSHQPLAEDERNPVVLLHDTEKDQKDQPYDKTISGTVTDQEEGEPLPGVNVLAKGTTIGTVTDVEGKFRFTVGDDVETLVFSSIGYQTQEVQINGRNVIDIALPTDVQSLSEVVVIGYGTQKKSDLTGSVANIKSEKLLDRQSLNVSQALQGRVPGVDVYANTAAPGQPAKIRIRGINSINSGVDPLFVVDGVIGINANFLDPNNIESVDVLKDASSTAIYGARGANGVIIITTKRGLEGSFISYEGFGSYSVPSKSIPSLNATEFMEVYNLAFANAAKYDPDGFADGRYQPNRVEDFPELFDASGNPRYNTNWEDLIYRPAWAQNHHLNIQGGANKTVYSLSGGYTDQDGIMRNSFFKRGNIRFTLDNRIQDWLRVGGSITGLFSKQRISDDNSGALNVPRMVMEGIPIVPIKYPDGSWGSNADWPGMEGGENPVRLTDERQRLNNRTELLGDFYVHLDITKNLNFKTSFGYDLNANKSNHYSGRDLNGFSANQKGYADINTFNSTYWQSENYFTYTKDVFTGHKLEGLLGFSWQEFYYESTFASAENFIDDFYGWHNLGVGNVRAGLNSDDSRWALNSYFGRINYNILDRYIFTATGRFDGSSKFGKNNKFAFFPSVGLAWRVSEESFFDVAPVSNLKLRASAGATGNQEIGSFASLQFLGTETVLLDGDRQTGINRSSFGNPDLKWEVTNQYDLGVELGLLDDRIQLEADLYYKRTNDLLLNAPIPWSTGLSSVTQNIGAVENKGLELSLYSTNVSTGDFSWSTNLNWAANRNKILKLGINDDDIFPGPWFLGQTNILRVGEPIGSLWGYRRLGTWGSDEADEAAQFDRLPGDLKWEDINDDGVLDAQDETIIGRAYPKWTMNISNTLVYKGFDFTFDIRFVYGVNIVNATKHSVEDRQAIANSMATVLNAWTPENQNTHIAQIRHYNAGYDTHMDDWWAEDGSFIRGQNFMLGYSFPQSTLEKIGLQKVRVYASVQNLFVASDYTGYDPEATTFGGSLTQNIEFFQYPKPRTFNVGVSVSFYKNTQQ